MYKEGDIVEVFFPADHPFFAQAERLSGIKQSPWMQAKLLRLSGVVFRSGAREWWICVYIGSDHYATTTLAGEDTFRPDISNQLTSASHL